jgi:predicted TPR repeat methyltransferase
VSLNLPNQNQNDDTFTSLSKGSTDSEAVKQYYNEWAKDYDQTLGNWEYRTPADAASLMCPNLNAGDRILDVGCGTGMFAKELKHRVQTELHGVDISNSSLQIAKQRNIYETLTQHDLQDLPLPFKNESFDGIGCVGVLTYIEDIGGLLNDFCRIVRSGGQILFTQRDDRWDEKEFDKHIADLKSSENWTPLHISGPKPYLPKNVEFGDAIKVIHVLCRVQ